MTLTLTVSVNELCLRVLLPLVPPVIIMDTYLCTVMSIATTPVILIIIIMDTYLLLPSCEHKALIL